MSNITTFEILDREIQKVSGKPVVLEALWDGDTQGWYLCLSLYTSSDGNLNKGLSCTRLGNVSLGTDIRAFTGEGWTEAVLAKELGAKAVEKYQLKFYFPADKEPDDDCPSWTERHLAIHCADCNKLIIPSDSPYLPKDICFNCHLTREQNERIKVEKPYDDGVTMYLTKNDEYLNIGYCTHFQDFTIAPFIQDQVQRQRTGDPIDIVTLDKQTILELRQKLQEELHQRLANYQKRDARGLSRRIPKFYKVEYNGIEYELDRQFNAEHRKISDLISCIKTTEKAILEHYVYQIYFKNGITYRDDSMLRFINYPSKGSVSIQGISDHFIKILTETEVLETLKKLEQIGCITINHNSATITGIGRNIV